MSCDTSDDAGPPRSLPTRRSRLAPVRETPVPLPDLDPRTPVVAVMAGPALEIARVVSSCAIRRRYPWGMGELRRRLHEESRPLTWDKLVDPQRAVVRGIHQLLGEICEDETLTVASIPAAPRLGGILSIVRRRSNRVVLIDGDRGTGKTSVLVTLVDLWAQNAESDSLPGDSEARTALSSLESLAVVPTPIVDLQPLAENVHLMLHVCGELKRLIELLGQRAETVDQRPRAESEERWEAFAHAAGKVWQPRNDRSSRLAPEDLTEELGDIETARLGLAEAFRQFIDALVEDVRKAMAITRELVFAVPIDDADLSPWRSLEVLDLARWLYHPRVVFVLAGDGAMFERVIHADILGNLGRPLRDVTSTRTELQTLYGEGRIESLAHDIYDKLVPPSHRFRMRVLRAGERLEWASDVLRSVSLVVDDARLRHLGVGAPIELLGYMAQAKLGLALPSELRRLHQILKTAGDKSLRDEPTRDARHFVLALVRDAWLRSGLEVEGVQDISDAEFIDLAAEVKFQLACTPRHRFSDTQHEAARFEVVSEHAELSGSLDVEGQKRKLPAQLVHGFMLVNGLRIDSEPGSPTLPRCIAVLCARPDGTNQPWPGVKLRSHLEQRAFLRYVHGLLLDNTRDEESFVVGYLGKVMSLRDSRFDSKPATDVHGLIARAATWYRQGKRSRAAQIVEIAAPEFGLSTDLASRWLGLGEQGFGDAWPILRETLMERRHKRIEDTDVQASEDHPWLIEIEDKVPPVLKSVIDGLEKAGFALPTLYRRLLRRIRPVPDKDVPLRIGRSHERARPRQLVLNLWGSVSRYLSPKSDLVVELEGPDLRVLPPRDPWEQLKEADREMAASDKVAFKAVLFEGFSGEGHLEAALHAPSIMVVHDLAWDLAVHARTAQLLEALPSSWRRWPGALCSTVAQVQVALWPVPAFETFLDVTMLCEYWNRLIDTLRDDPNVEPHFMVEFVAYAFIGSIVDVCHPRSKTAESSDSLDLDRTLGTPPSWQKLATRIAKLEEADPSVGPGLPRERAFAKWQRIWRVFAAPELGLSDRVSNAILTSRGKKLPAPERESLQTARVQLCAEAGIPLINASQNHPWMRLVEQVASHDESA